MSAIRKEVQEYIDSLSDKKLEALKPLLTVLSEDSVIVETDLTDEEKEIIAKGREEYKDGGFMLLDNI